MQYKISPNDLFSEIYSKKTINAANANAIVFGVTLPWFFGVTLPWFFGVTLPWFETEIYQTRGEHAKQSSPMR
jgi:hypothetical protein